jgi:hypothetical protein
MKKPRAAVSEDGGEEVFELVVAAQGCGNAHPSAADGEDGEQDEGECHDPGGLVDGVVVLFDV